MLRDYFEVIYDLVMNVLPLGNNMLRISENSKWHREKNVKEHTRMVLQWYENNLMSKRNERQIFLTRLALLFHDVGKPRARTEKHSEERGVYYSYPGHEKYSARLFEDFVMSYRHSVPEIAVLNWNDVHIVKMMIEHHLPYELQNPQKLHDLKLALFLTGEDTIPMFFDVLLSDAHGRISDDPDGTYARADDWIEKFAVLPVYYTPPPEVSSLSFHILVGAAGSGKSTLIEKHLKGNVAVFGNDLQRLEFFKLHNGIEVGADEAFNFCVKNEKEFEKFVWQNFTSLLKTKQPIILDNTNLTTKVRRKWITAARQAGYNIIAVELPNSLEEIKHRQQFRGNKAVPKKSVETQYFAQSTPLIGSEVDFLLVKTPEDETFAIGNH